MKLEYDLLNNGIDSLSHAVDLLAWRDTARSNKYKQAILCVVHCVEMLLKERLFRENPALVWQNIDKYPSRDANTINIETAMNRLEKICRVSISEYERHTIEQCKKLRNTIQHFDYDKNEKLAKVRLAKTMSFAFDFAKRELGVDLQETYQDDDTWRSLIFEFDEFMQEYGVLKSKRDISEVDSYDDCIICGFTTFNVDTENCDLCGAEYPL